MIHQPTTRDDVQELLAAFSEPLQANVYNLGDMISVAYPRWFPDGPKITPVIQIVRDETGAWWSRLADKSLPEEFTGNIAKENKGVSILDAFNAGYNDAVDSFGPQAR